jgi:hypothetical protein
VSDYPFSNLGFFFCYIFFLHFVRFSFFLVSLWAQGYSFLEYPSIFCDFIVIFFSFCLSVVLNFLLTSVLTFIFWLSRLFSFWEYLFPCDFFFFLFFCLSCLVVSFTLVITFRLLCFLLKTRKTKTKKNKQRIELKDKKTRQNKRRRKRICVRNGVFLSFEFHLERHSSFCCEIFFFLTQIHTSHIEKMKLFSSYFLISLLCGFGAKKKKISDQQLID